MIKFTINKNTNAVYGYDSDEKSQALARTRLLEGHDIYEPTIDQEEIFNAIFVDTKNKILHAIYSKRYAIAGTYDNAEIAGWTQKLIAAKSIKNGAPSDLDIEMFEKEINTRGLGETVEQLAEKVINNASIFVIKSAWLDGLKKYASLKIKTITNKEGLENLQKEIENELSRG